jgi:hypothetical protein
MMKNNIEGNALEPKLIDIKAADECPDKALLYSTTYIKQLNDHNIGVIHQKD